MNHIKKIIPLFLLLFLTKAHWAQAEIPLSPRIDSLLKAINSAKNDTIKVAVLNNLGSAYLEISEFDKAIETIDKTIAIAEKINYKRGLAFAYNNAGIVYDYKSDYIKSLDYHNQALKLRKELGDQKGISASYGNMAIVYEYLGKFPEALKCHYDALIIDEKLGDKNGVGIVNINMASVYIQQQKLKESEACLLKAKKLFTEIKAAPGLAYAESGLGTIALYQKNYPKAVEHTELAIKMFGDLGSIADVAACQVSLAQIYMQLKKYKEAESALTSSLKISNQIGDRRGSSMTYLGLANLFSATKGYAKAKPCIDSAIAIAKSIRCVQCLKDHYSSYAQIDSAMQNFRGAFLNLKLFNRYNDSLISEENTKKSNQAKLQYDFDRKAIADSLKNAEIKIKAELEHQQEIKQQKIYSYGAVLGFILMLVIAGISYRAFKQKQKTSRIIEQQKNIVEEKQKEIVDSIHYAKRIQQSLFPTEKYIEKNLKK